MLSQLKQLFTQSLESFSDNPESFNKLQQILALENDYNRLSNDRFANNPDYQVKQKKMLTSLSGASKLLSVVGRFKP